MNLVYLFLIWLIATAFNITKAVHIDDTAFLEIARHITRDPLHPFSGWINWYDTTLPISSLLHPPLVPYLYALVMAIFGESEIVLHLVISLFTLFSVFFFYLLARYFVPKIAYILTAIFILGPTFLPAQNLMTDIPLLTFILAFFWAIITPVKNQKYRIRYFLAGLFIGLASLTKYASFILLPILILHIFLTRRWRYLWVVLIPIFIIILWSLFNYLEYGRFHILDAKNNYFNLTEVKDRLLVFIIALGAMTPFSIIFLRNMIFNKKILILITSVLIAIFFSWRYWHFLGEPKINYYLRLYFFTNGILITSLIMVFIWEKFQQMKKNFSQAQVNFIILATWFFGLTTYMIIFVPFMAVRHLLLVMPAVIFILGLSVFAKINKKAVWIGTFITIFLGVAVSLSDWIYADIYRVYAPKIEKNIRAIQLKERAHSTVWFGGHWGWQWYTARSGMKQYDTWRTIFQNGDYLVMPSVERQYINPLHASILKPVETILVPPSPFTTIRIMTDFPLAPRGYYALGYRYLPWTISKQPLEEFTIYKVAI
jgi:4-amino-4-deoxy-L-arabinose transferase-like glycosyltransferase